jgi:hypothetical protein
MLLLQRVHALQFRGQSLVVLYQRYAAVHGNCAGKRAYVPAKTASARASVGRSRAVGLLSQRSMHRGKSYARLFCEELLLDGHTA